MDLHKLVLSLLPKNLISFAVGVLVRLKLPGPLSRLCNKAFASLFSLDMAEAGKPLEGYHSIEEVFIRTLKPGARSWHPGLSSPADGTIVMSAPVRHGDEAVQVKGLTYSLKELIYGDQPASADGICPHWYTTVYLAPYNYHRVHTPLAGTLTRVHYVPGTLWPVNRRFTRLLPRLFCRNERLVFDLRTESGNKIAVVMIGAFNVGRIATAYAPMLTTNTSRRQLCGTLAAVEREKKLALPLAAGAELGVFMLGSTVVVVCDKAAVEEFKPRLINADTAVKVGEKL